MGIKKGGISCQFLARKFLPVHYLFGAVRSEALLEKFQMQELFCRCDDVRMDDLVFDAGPLILAAARTAVLDFVGFRDFLGDLCEQIPVAVFEGDLKNSLRQGVVMSQDTALSLQNSLDGLFRKPFWIEMIQNVFHIVALFLEKIENYFLKRVVALLGQEVSQDFAATIFGE